MIQTNIKELRKPRWFKPYEDDDVEVLLVPAASVEVARGMLLGDEGLCRDAFIEFKNYWQDNEKKVPVDNTLESRMELLTWNTLRDEIRVKLGQWNEAIARGEDLDG